MTTRRRKAPSPEAGEAGRQLAELQRRSSRLLGNMLEQAERAHGPRPTDPDAGAVWTAHVAFDPSTPPTLRLHCLDALVELAALARLHARASVLVEHRLRPPPVVCS